MARIVNFEPEIAAAYEPAMAQALDEARKAVAHGDVPVGAVVILDGEIVASRHNEREVSGDPTAHAEVLALRDAAAVVGSWRLSDCTIVVTLEPCAMCAGAIVNARCATLVYGAPDVKAGAALSLFNITEDARLNHRVETIAGVSHEACSQLLTEFFEARRS